MKEENRPVGNKVKSDAGNIRDDSMTDRGYLILNSYSA